MENEQKDDEQNESGVIEHNATLVHGDATCIFSDQTKTASTFDQLDHAKWRAFIKDHFSLECSSSEPVTGMALLRQMNLAYDETHVNITAVLLFGSNLALCGTEYVIRAGVISHDAPAKADDVAMFSGTLEQIYANAFKWLMAAQLHSGHGAHLPEAVVQEVLTNALLHRDYRIAAPIRIKVYSDRVEIVSPGCLPGPLTVESAQKGCIWLRNPVLTAIASRGFLPYRGLGSGLSLVKERWPQTTFYNDKENGLFIVVLPVPRPVAVQQQPSKMQHLNKRQQQLFAAIKAHPTAKYPELAKIAKMHRSTVTRNVKIMKRMGILKRVGSTPWGSWKCEEPDRSVDIPVREKTSNHWNFP